MRQQIGDVTLIRGDCLDVMPKLGAQGSKADLIFADLPYGVLSCKWDSQISLISFWQCAFKTSNPNAIFCFTATQPFSSALVMSQPSLFKYDLVWKKNTSGGFLHAKRRPINRHESILVFYRMRSTYNPQKTTAKKIVATSTRPSKSESFSGLHGNNKYNRWVDDGLRFPTSIQHFDRDDARKSYSHPTQKPVALLEWLIRTYTNDGDTILDPVAGSGTTAIAAMRVGNRKVICIEKDAGYYDAMVKRVANEQAALNVNPAAAV